MSYTPRRIAEQKKIDLRGLTFHIHRWPGENPEPIVLLHGFADCGATFQFLVDALPDQYTLLAIDHRGFGQTQWPQDGYWFPDYLADLDAWLEMLSPHSPLTLIGHSMGGHVATLYAGIRPERVSRCINLEGFGIKPTVPSDAPGRYKQWLDEVKAANAFARYKAYEHPSALADTLMRRHPHLKRDHAEFVASVWTTESSGSYVLRTDPKHKRVNPILYRHEEVQACWQQVTAPVLFIGGEQSEYYDLIRDHLRPEVLNKDFKNARVVAVSNAGHMMHWEQPAAIARLIVDFLSTLSTP
jgi:pimeloyl-ACP methyl ester carboxylesterase